MSQIKSEKEGKDVKGSILNHFYFSIVEYVRQHGYLPKCYGSRQNLNYYIQHLKRMGILIKKGYGVWAVNEQYYPSAKDVKGSIRPPAFPIRGHGFFFVTTIPKLDNWEYRKDYLCELGIKTKDVIQGVQFEYKECKVILCRKSIIVYFPEHREYLKESALECRQAALYDHAQLLIGLENLLKVSLRSQGRFRSQISRQHYAEVGNEIAADYAKRNEWLNVIGRDGKEWVLVDASTGIAEFETVHAQMAHQDMQDKLKPFLNDLRDYPEPILLSKMIDVIAYHGQLLGLDASLLNKPKSIKDKQTSLRDSYFG